MTTTNLWRQNNRDYSMNPNIYQMFNAIKNSNIDEDTKYAILAKMAGYDSSDDETNSAIRETILRVLTETHKPMRVSEFTYGNVETHCENPNVPLYDFTIQRVTAQMRFLVCAGLVARMEMLTGRKIEIEGNSLFDEVIAFYQIID